MSSFTTKLIVEVEDDGIHSVVHQVFTYALGRLNSGINITVPVGYRTDFASVPWGIRWLLPAHGKYGKAAVIHDYLCTYRHVMVDGVGVFITREQADAIFLEAMTVLKVPAWQKYSMYVAVRAYANTTGLDIADYAKEAEKPGYFTDVLALVDKRVA